jgi:hypothetical protein
MLSFEQTAKIGIESKALVFSLEPLSLSTLYSPEQTKKCHSERKDCYAAKALETDVKPTPGIV